MKKRVRRKAKLRLAEKRDAHRTHAKMRFFERFGFIVVEYKSTVIRGVSLSNAHMRKRMKDAST